MTSDYSFDTGKIKLFTTWDYVLFTATLLVSAVIGIVFAIKDRNNHSTQEFLLGGRKMSVLPVAFSLMVTFMSAITLLGNPAEIYLYNTMFWWLCGAFFIAMIFAAVVFIPFFYNLGVLSTFEFLQMRFGKAVRISGCCVLITQTMLYMAFLLYAPSLALNAVTGLDLWGSVIGMGIVVTFYTSLGGMKAVLWTDTFQALVIFAGLLAVIIKGSMIQGGFDKAWEMCNSRDRIHFDDFNPDPKTRHSVWSMVVGGWAFWTFLYGVNQAQVQRCLSVPSVTKAKLALFINLPGLMMIVSFACMVGIVMFAFYKDCHPITFGIIAKSDQLVPLFVMDILGDFPGVPGIFVSCIISGSLSSLSSGLNALTTVTLRDILQQTCLKRELTDFQNTLISKGLVVFYGALAVGLAYVVSLLGNVLQAVYVVFGMLNGPLLGLFTLGMWFPWANKHGALGGLFFSLAFLLWVGIGSFANDLKTPMTGTSVANCNWAALNKTAPTTTPMPTATMEEESDPFMDMYRMSYMYYTALGMILVWAIGIPISFCTGYTRPKSLDPRLICPLVEILCPCLPVKVRDFFRFGIVHEGKYDKYRHNDEADDNKPEPEYTAEPGVKDEQKFGQNDYPLGRQISSKSGAENQAYDAEESKGGYDGTRL